MGFKYISLKLPPDYSDEQLTNKIAQKLRLKSFTYQIERKSLDARKKRDIHWQLQVVVASDDLKGSAFERSPLLNIPYHKNDKKVVVVGSGPAGFFAALVLQKAGFRTTIIERGANVHKRAREIEQFERTGQFSPMSNYAFGEGGAGTFSDGKLTSRSVSTTAEKDFMIASYIQAGAPAEIAWMAHPHVGSDNLRLVVKNLRAAFQRDGGNFHFETMLQDLIVRDGRVQQLVTSAGPLAADELVIACGHSAYETYRMLMGRGVLFRPKSFAIGSRVEHPQALINRAQWGCERLPGVKAAEYRLTCRAGRPVYTFCMCPGGMVVPATAYADANIVNGMSLYQRAGHFANAACVAGVHPDELLGRESSAADALDYVSDLERQFYDFSGYRAPSCSIREFLMQQEPSQTSDSSYPLGLQPAALWRMLPTVVTDGIRTGLVEFSKKLPGYESGALIGLESKTSAPIQVVRERCGLCAGFENLYMVGEGSGWAGGIISSGVDGIRAAMAIIGQHQ
ncbi:NAD(P)/FAD-dependent oxidoreductase [candidate division KSB1 bacterium]|nr:NAD(P)/FAD-dependent oxidoreductase [candidate division KSB1 bacterium]